MVFARQRRHLDRYVEIGRILAKHGWQNLIARIGLSGVLGVRGRGGGPAPAPVQVRQALEELGPTYIKLGQLLSTRADIIPREYVEELQKLQDTATPVPISDIHSVIEDEFGEPVEALFASFNSTPIGSASLGQTHSARMADGTSVVVKVQRPGIRRMIDNDLEIMGGLARLLDHHFEQLRVYALPDLVEEFSITMRQELDYTREGRNGDTLRKNLQRLEYVRVAATIWERTTPRVLTMECVSGIKITDTADLDLHAYDRRRIASNLTRAFLTMVLIDGFFHADPHPGNLVVLEGNVIGLLDYGMVGRLDRQLKSNVVMLLADYIRKDSSAFSEVLLDIGIVPFDLDRKEYTQAIDRFLRQYYDAPLRELQMGQVLREALRISAKHRVRLPSSLALLVKVIVQTEAITKVLQEDFDFTEESRGFIARALGDEFSPNALGIQLIESVLSWKNLILDLPHHVSDVLERMSSGTFRIAFKHEGLENSIKDIDKSANRLSFALVVSSTIIGSSLILAAGIGPSYRGFPIVGLIGFGIAFLSGAWLIISILRANKLW